jgi:hypothetical protein
MLELYQDHCQVVKEALQGERTIDERTYASIAVLDDRLARVKKMGEKFSRIEFSPAIKHLITRPSKLAIG